jgi:hypothetical protein
MESRRHGSVLLPFAFCPLHFDFLFQSPPRAAFPPFPYPEGLSTLPDTLLSVFAANSVDRKRLEGLSGAPGGPPASLCISLKTSKMRKL